MDEHAEARLAPPLHASIPLRGRFGVLNGEDGMMRGCGVYLVALQLGIAQSADSEEGGGSDALGQIQADLTGRSSGLKIVGENCVACAKS